MATTSTPGLTRRFGFAVLVASSFGGVATVLAMFPLVESSEEGVGVREAIFTDHGGQVAMTCSDKTDIDFDRISYPQGVQISARAKRESVFGFRSSTIADFVEEPRSLIRSSFCDHH